MKKVAEFFMLASDEQQFVEELARIRPAARFVVARDWSAGEGRFYPLSQELPAAVLYIGDATVFPDSPDGVQWMRSQQTDVGVLSSGRLAIDIGRDDPPAVHELVKDIWDVLKRIAAKPALVWPDGTVQKGFYLTPTLVRAVADGSVSLVHGAMRLRLPAG